MIDLTPITSAIKQALAAGGVTLGYLVCLGALGVAFCALRVVLLVLRERKQ
jgi:hypothetical protein